MCIVILRSSWVHAWPDLQIVERGRKRRGRKRKELNCGEFANWRKIIRCPLKECVPPCANDLATGLSALIWHCLVFSLTLSASLLSPVHTGNYYFGDYSLQCGRGFRRPIALTAYTTVAPTLLLYCRPHTVITRHRCPVTLLRHRRELPDLASQETVSAPTHRRGSYRKTRVPEETYRCHRGGQRVDDSVTERWVIPFKLGGCVTVLLPMLMHIDSLVVQDAAYIKTLCTMLLKPFSIYYATSCTCKFAWIINDAPIIGRLWNWVR